MMRTAMIRTEKINVGTAALGCPVERSSTAMGIGKTGKGTTSVVPFASTRGAALSAEGQLKHLVEGSRFPGSRFMSSRFII
jgi:hypothetical protein